MNDRPTTPIPAETDHLRRITVAYLDSLFEAGESEDMGSRSELKSAIRDIEGAPASGNPFGDSMGSVVVWYQQHIKKIEAWGDNYS